MIYRAERDVPATGSPIFYLRLKMLIILAMGGAGAVAELQCTGLWRVSEIKGLIFLEGNNFIKK